MPGMTPQASTSVSNYSASLSFHSARESLPRDASCPPQGSVREAPPAASAGPTPASATPVFPPTAAVEPAPGPGPAAVAAAEQGAGVQAPPPPGQLVTDWSWLQDKRHIFDALKPRLKAYLAPGLLTRETYKVVRWVPGSAAQAGVRYSPGLQLAGCADLPACRLSTNNTVTRVPRSLPPPDVLLCRRARRPQGRCLRCSCPRAGPSQTPRLRPRCSRRFRRRWKARSPRPSVAAR